MSTLHMLFFHFPYTTIFRSVALGANQQSNFAYSSEDLADLRRAFIVRRGKLLPVDFYKLLKEGDLYQNIYLEADDFIYMPGDRKSTRLNSSHLVISYAVFCL